MTRNTIDLHLISLLCGGQIVVCLVLLMMEAMAEDWWLGWGDHSGGWWCVNLRRSAML
jgi:hypothetical protein